jgi:hypothetical protein
MPSGRVPGGGADGRARMLRRSGGLELEGG